MSQEITIKNLIVAAAEGAGEGVEVLQESNIPVELEEFEIEVTYAAETSIESTVSSGSSLKYELKFVTFKQKFSGRVTTKSTATYGMKVRFLFTGTRKEEEQ